MNRKIIISLVFIVCILIITTIIIVAIPKEDKARLSELNTYMSEIVEDECTEEYVEMTPKVTTVSSAEEKVAANAILMLKKYYKKCDHTTNEYVEIPQEIVNMNKEQVQMQYPDWKIIGFEKGKVILYKEFDDVCGEHFKLKIEDGKIIIYLINSDGTESVYEKTNISSEYLTETDLINMQDGLEVYGKEELNQIIEDFE